MNTNGNTLPATQSAGAVAKNNGGFKLLQKAHNEQAYLKAGFLGFPGTGKSYTASALARGIAARLGDKRPVAYFDTETGSDFLLPQFQADGIELVRLKSFAFTKLLEVAREAEAACSVLIVDSVTHIWRELCESYAKKRNIRKMQFQHWGDVKKEWAEWTNFYLNSKIHIIVCGRAGFEWDFQNDDDGKKELIKVGTKMKVESEFGFEPSLLVEMERADRSSKPGAGWIHRAHILKDRSDTINGMAFDFQRTKGGYKKGGFAPILKAFKPVIDCLNLGGEHLGVDTSQNSEGRFNGPSGEPNWKVEEQAHAIALDEILELLRKHYPGSTDEAKRKKADAIEKHANTRSWKAVEALDLYSVQNLRNALWEELEGCQYGRRPVKAPIDDDDISFEE